MAINHGGEDARPIRKQAEGIPVNESSAEVNLSNGQCNHSLRLEFSTNFIDPLDEVGLSLGSAVEGGPPPAAAKLT